SDRQRIDAPRGLDHHLRGRAKSAADRGLDHEQFRVSRRLRGRAADFAGGHVVARRGNFGELHDVVRVRQQLLRERAKRADQRVRPGSRPGRAATMKWLMAHDSWLRLASESRWLMARAVLSPE